MPAIECMIDNVVRSRERNTESCIKTGRKNYFLVGNTFTVTNPVAAGPGRTVELARKTLDRTKVIVPATLRLPGVPVNKHGKIFEVRPATGDDTSELQRQIDAAAAEPANANP